MAYKNTAQYIQELADQFLGKVIFNIGSSIINLDEQISEQAKLSLQVGVQSIREYCIRTAFNPSSNHENIFKSFILAMNELHRTFEIHKNFRNIELILTNIAEIACFLDLTVFDANKIPCKIREFFYPHLHNLTQLQVLKLSTDTSLKFNLCNREKMLIDVINNMDELEEFVLPTYCTDKIVETVGQKCKKIMHLDVTYSKDVTNKSINFLIKYPSLEEVHLNHTSVDVLGYLKLLTNCPNLKNFGKCLKMHSLLDQLNERKDQLKLNTEIFKAVDLETKHLEMLAQICPNLMELDVKLKNADISVLKTLSHLQSIKVKSANFWNIVTLLEKVGPNIRNLDLESINGVELISISYLCPNLKRLAFNSCKFSDRIVEQDSWGTYLSSVESLLCDKTVPLIQLKFLLANCPRVKVLELPAGENFTDKYLDEILNLNQMNELEELHIKNCECLTVASFSKIFSGCKKLKKVTGMDKCTLVSKDDLGNLEKLFPHLTQYFNVMRMN